MDVDVGAVTFNKTHSDERDWTLGERQSLSFTLV